MFLLELTLFFYKASAFEVCGDGDDYIYSDNLVQVERCSDEKQFVYTERYENETYCVYSATLAEGECWWDTTVESHCLESAECVWLDEIYDEGLCYCAVTTECDVCNNKTPAPTVNVSTSECPDYCKVYYLGCVGMYCNCLGECASPEVFGCVDPVDPECYLWYTFNPSEMPSEMPSIYSTTAEPTATTSLYWNCNMCCISESDITITSSLIAVTLDLDNDQVYVASYQMAASNTSGQISSSQSWDIIYGFEVEEGITTDELNSSLSNSTWSELIFDEVSASLDVIIQASCSVSDTYTTFDSAGGTSLLWTWIIIIILNAVCFCCIIVLAICRYRRNEKEASIRTKMTAEYINDHSYQL